MWFRTGPTQTELYKQRGWLKAGSFRFRKWRNYTIRVAKTQVLISFAVTAKLIYVFVFAYADCWFSHEAVHMSMRHMILKGGHDINLSFLDKSAKYATSKTLMLSHTVFNCDNPELVI